MLSDHCNKISHNKSVIFKQLFRKEIYVPDFLLKVYLNICS